MPAFGSDITINDGAAVPVAKTFNPMQRDNLVAMYAEKSSGIPIGYVGLSVSNRAPTDLAKGIYKVRIKMYKPTLDVTSPSTGSGIQPAPSVAYTLQSVTDFFLPARSTLQERKDLLALQFNALNHATIKDVVWNLSNIF